MSQIRNVLLIIVITICIGICVMIFSHFFDLFIKESVFFLFTILENLSYFNGIK